MNDLELLSILDTAEKNAVQYNSEFMKENELALKYYLSEPFGDEVEDKSQVVSSDVQDLVEADMPSLARVFLGNSRIVKFEAPSGNPEDEQEAEEKTNYVDWLIRKQPESFRILHGWIKDALIQKVSVVKYFIDDTRKTTEHTYENISFSELEEIRESLAKEGGKVEVISTTIPEGESFADQEFDITFRVTTGSNKLKIINVPNESFLISKGSEDFENAELIGDTIRKTRGDLLADGYDKDLINQLPTIDSDDGERSELKTIRAESEGSESETISGWASELVSISDLYVLVDYDGDGIVERRHILKSGNVIIENEAFPHVPYAGISAILMAHKAIGRSRADLAMTTQRVKSVLLRQTLDNAYMANNSRNIVSDDVDMDDYLTVRPNGAVRTEGSVHDAVYPLVTEFTGDKSLMLVQYMDQARAQSTGSLMASQGLDEDALSKETATRFNGVKDASSAKVELVSRVIVETGIRKLYEGAAWMVSRYQDAETEFKVLGKALKTNPKNWKYEHYIVSNVGIGAGNDENTVLNVQSLLMIQNQLKAAGSKMVDESKIYNSVARIVEGLDFPRVDEFFNNPEQPHETLQAENEILKKALEQTQLLLDQSQNPLAEAETINAKSELMQKQADMNLQVERLREEQRQFNIESAQKQEKLINDLTAKLTELELKYNKDVEGAAV